jgi:hypothetical protein
MKRISADNHSKANQLFSLAVAQVGSSERADTIEVANVLITGSGKGTQCEKLIAKYGFTHLSAGDLIRAAVKDPSSEKGRHFNEVMSQGKLISMVGIGARPISWNK